MRAAGLPKEKRIMNKTFDFMQQFLKDTSRANSADTALLRKEPQPPWRRLPALTIPT